MKQLISLSLSVLFVVFLAACEGPVGPQGPPGPAGATGPQGPAGQDGASTSILSRSGNLNAGGVGGTVIRNASIEDVVVNCWISEEGEVWILVSLDADFGISCVAIQDGNDVDVRIVNGVPDWFYLIVAIIEE